MCSDTSNACLYRGIGRVSLHVLIRKALLPGNLRNLSAATLDNGFDVDLSSCFDSDIYVAIGPYATRGGGNSVRARRVFGHASSSWLRRRVCDHLQVSRHIPVAVDTMIRLCRDDINSKGVRLPIGQ